MGGSRLEHDKKWPLKSDSADIEPDCEPDNGTFDDSDLHAVVRPESALSNLSDISHSNSAACSAIVSDIGTSEDDESSDDDDSSSDDDSSDSDSSDSDSGGSSSSDSEIVDQTENIQKVNKNQDQETSYQEYLESSDLLSQVLGEFEK